MCHINYPYYVAASRMIWRPESLSNICVDILQFFYARLFTKLSFLQYWLTMQVNGMKIYLTLLFILFTINFLNPQIIQVHTCNLLLSFSAEYNCYCDVDLNVIIYMYDSCEIFVQFSALICIIFSNIFKWRIGGEPIYLRIDKYSNWKLFINHYFLFSSNLSLIVLEISIYLFFSLTIWNCLYS